MMILENPVLAALVLRDTIFPEVARLIWSHPFLSQSRQYCISVLCKTGISLGPGTGHTTLGKRAGSGELGYIFSKFGRSLVVVSNLFNKSFLPFNAEPINYLLREYTQSIKELGVLISDAFPYRAA